MLLLKNCSLKGKFVDILIENKKILKIGSIDEKKLQKVFDKNFILIYDVGIKNIQ